MTPLRLFKYHFKTTTVFKSGEMFSAKRNLIFILQLVVVRPQFQFDTTEQIKTATMRTTVATIKPDILYFDKINNIPAWASNILSSAGDFSYQESNDDQSKIIMIGQLNTLIKFTDSLNNKFSTNFITQAFKLQV